MSGDLKKKLSEELVRTGISVNPDDLLYIVCGSPTRLFVRDQPPVEVTNMMPQSLLKAHSDYVNAKEVEKRKRDSDVELRNGELLVWAPYLSSEVRSVRLVFSNE